MATRRVALPRLAVALVVAVLAAACAEESAAGPRANSHYEGVRMQQPASDMRGGGDMPSKGRGGEHKIQRMK